MELRHERRLSRASSPPASARLSGLGRASRYAPGRLELASELFDHRARTAFDGNDERVFCSPTKGTPFDVARYAAMFQLALATAGVEGYVRPFHDARHTSITNATAAGTPPAALMARAGHSDFKTTQGYIDLAGEMFREEADQLEKRLWGDSGTQKPVPKRLFVVGTDNEPGGRVGGRPHECRHFVWLNGAA